MKGDSLFAFVAGAAAGLTLGLLFAPEKGEDTRRKLKETVGDAVDLARARARLARMELDDLKAELKDQAEDLKDDVRMKTLSDWRNWKVPFRKTLNMPKDNLKTPDDE